VVEVAVEAEAAEEAALLAVQEELLPPRSGNPLHHQHAFR
jgi:hypothetical protein